PCPDDERERQRHEDGCGGGVVDLGVIDPEPGFRARDRQTGSEEEGDRQKRHEVPEEGTRVTGWTKGGVSPSPFRTTHSAPSSFYVFFALAFGFGAGFGGSVVFGVSGSVVVELLVVFCVPASTVIRLRSPAGTFTLRVNSYVFPSLFHSARTS